VCDARESRDSRAPQSGRPDSNWRPLAPKASALTRLSYTPRSLERPHSVTVCTDKIAHRDLRQNCPSADASMNERADVPRLSRLRTMIPLHRGGMEPAATVDARLRRLQASIPVLQFGAASLTTPKAMATSSLPVRSVVLPSTELAPCLANPAPSMKILHRLRDTTSTARLHVVRLDDVSDGGRGGYSWARRRSSAIFSLRRSARSPARTRASSLRTSDASSTGLKGFVT
jgi:hypothetical protein